MAAMASSMAPDVRRTITASAAAQAATAGAATARAATAGAMTLADRLKVLKECLEQNLITEEQLDRATMSLLQGFVETELPCIMGVPHIPGPSRYGKTKSSLEKSLSEKSRSKVNLASADAAGDGLAGGSNFWWAAMGPFTRRNMEVEHFDNTRVDNTRPGMDDDNLAHLSSEAKIGVEMAAFWTRHIDEAWMAAPAHSRSKVDVRRHNDLRMSDLQAFDISTSRVEDLFRTMDADKNNLLAPDEFIEVLRTQNLTLSENSAKAIIDRVRGIDEPEGSVPSEDRADAINIHEFDHVLTLLRLAELFTPKSGFFQFYEETHSRQLCTIFVYDYNLTECIERSVKLVDLNSGKKVANDTEEKSFFFGPGHDAMESVRWLHVDASEGLDRLTLMRLAVRYHYHPLAVDDIIDNRTSTKIDRFADHYFISVDILQMAKPPGGSRKKMAASQRSMSMAEDGLADHPQRVRVHRSNVSIFLPYSYSMILTILQERPDESSWMGLWKGTSEEDRMQPDCDIWRLLSEDLTQQPPQRMREQKADFIVYEIFSRIVHLYRPIGEAYARRLGWMNRQDMSSFKQEWLNELRDVQFELVDLTRSIRPMRQVVRHLLEGRLGKTAKMYMEDVDDAIDVMLEDIAQLQQMAKQLQESNDQALDKRNQNTLFILSLVSATFLPMQFMSGVYGMNFEGGVGIPELQWNKGYYYFWLLEALIATIIGSIFFIAFSSHRCCGCLRRTRHLKYDNSGAAQEETLPR